MFWRKWVFEPNRIFWQCSGGSHVPKFAANGPGCQVVQKARCELTQMLSVVEWQKGRKPLPPLINGWAVEAECCPKIGCPVLHFIKSNDHGTDHLGQFKYLFWTIKNGTDRALHNASVLLLSQYRSGDSWRWYCRLTDHYLRQQQHRRSSLY